MKKYNFNKENVGLVFIAPAMIYLLFFMFYPILEGIRISFFEMTLKSSRFIGFKNFLRIFNDERVVNSIRSTFVYTFGVLIFHLLVGAVLALVLNSTIKFRKLFRMLLLSPWMVSGVVAGLTWRWIMNAQFGLLNDVLHRIGLIRESIQFLAEPELAMLSVVIATGWRGFPFVMVMFLAGLQIIPQEQYESAFMDGANRWQLFRFITVPNIRPIAMPVILLDFIWMFQYFDLIKPMTNGGPVYATEVLSINIYTNAFEYFHFGYSASIGVVLFVFLSIISAFYVKIYRTEVF